MFSVVVLKVVNLYFLMLYVIILGVVMLNVVTMCFVMLYVIMLTRVILNVVMRPMSYNLSTCNLPIGPISYSVCPL
jgi:hypothetical protein